jgi:hypothetical protein
MSDHSWIPRLPILLIVACFLEFCSIDSLALLNVAIRDNDRLTTLEEEERPRDIGITYA